VINVFLGWTVLGWIAALALACRSAHPARPACTWCSTCRPPGRRDHPRTAPDRPGDPLPVSLTPVLVAERPPVPRFPHPRGGTEAPPL